MFRNNSEKVEQNDPRCSNYDDVERNQAEGESDQVVFFMALAVGQIEPGTTETNLVGVSEVNGTHGMDINGAEGTEILGEAGVVDGVGDGVDKCELLVGKVSLHCETALRIAEIMVPNIYFTTEKRPEGEVIICQRNPSGQ